MTSRLPLTLALYRGSLTLLEPLAAGLLAWRWRKGKEDGARIGERRGFASRPRPRDRLAWLHGASVGETLSLLPLVERLTQCGVKVLVTSSTRTSADLLARRLPPGSLHQFFPLDVPRYLRRFLDHWRPDLVLFAESEIWPNTVIELGRRDIPLVMVNGRVSERSYRRWSRLPVTARALLERYALCVAQSPMDAERLARLGALRVAVAGNLKFDAPPPPADARALAHLSGLVAGRPVWIAASTHPGEEEAVAAVHQALANRLPGLLTILAPRHPERGPAVEDSPKTRACGRSGGPRAGCRSAGPTFMWPTLWGSWACSTAWRLWYSWAARSCPTAAKIRSSPPSSARRSFTGRTSTISRTFTPPSIMRAARFP